LSDYKGLEVVFEGDATGLQSALSQIDSTATTTESNLRNIGRALKVDPNNRQLLRMQGDEYKRLSDTARKRADVLSQAQDKANRKVEDSGAAYRKASSELDSAAASYDRLIKRHESNVSSIESLNRRIEKQRSGMTTAQRAADDAEGKFVEQKSKLRGLRKSARNLQNEMQGATARADAEFANKGYRALADYYQKRVDVEDEFSESSAGKSGSALAKQAEMRDAATRSLKAELSANIDSLRASRLNNSEVKRTTSAYNDAEKAVSRQARATTKAKEALEESTAALKKEGGEFNSTSKLIGARNLLSLNDDSIMDQMEDTENRLADLQTRQAKRKLEWVHAQNDASRISVEAVTNQKLADDYLQKSTRSYVESDLKGSRLYKFGEALDEFGQKAGAAADRSSKLSGRFSSLGQSAIMGLTVPLTVVGTKVTQLDEQFGSTMSQVKMYSGATKEQLGQLRDYALSLSSSSIYSSDEIGQAMNELAKAGQKPEQMMKKGGPLDSALSLAAAGQMDLADAAAKVVQVGSAFHIKTSDMTMVANVLANGANKSTAEVGDLANGLANCGQMAHTAGWSLKDTTAAIAFMADKGVDGATAGTQLKVMLQRLVNPTAKAQEVMEKYGFSARDAQGNVKDLSTLTQELYDKFGGLGAEERDSALGTMFGTRGINPVLALLNSVGDSANKSTGEIDGYIQACDTSKGATEMAAAQMSDYQKKITETKHSVENAGIALGESLEPNVEKGADLVKDLATQFTNLDSGTKNGVANVLTGLTLFGPVFTAFQKGVQWGFAPLASGIGKVAKFTSALAAYSSETAVAGSMTDAFALAADEAGINTAGLALGLKGMLAIAAVAGIAALVAETQKLAEKQEKQKNAVNGLSEAMDDLKDSSDATADAFDSSTARQERATEVHNKATESFDKMNDSLEDYYSKASDRANKIKNEVNSYEDMCSSLEYAGQVIDDYRGKADLSVSQLDELQAAIDTVNKACGTSYKLDANNNIVDDTGNIQDNTQAIWDNIHAREAQAKAHVYGDAAASAEADAADASKTLADSKKSWKDNLDDYKNAKENLKKAGVNLQKLETDANYYSTLSAQQRKAYSDWADASGRLYQSAQNAADQDKEYRKKSTAAANLRAFQEALSSGIKDSDKNLSQVVMSSDAAMKMFTGDGEQAQLSMSSFADTLMKVTDNSADLKKKMQDDPSIISDIATAYDGSAESIRGVLEGLGIAFDETAAKEIDAKGSLEAYAKTLSDAFENSGNEGEDYSNLLSMGFRNVNDMVSALNDAGISFEAFNKIDFSDFENVMEHADGSADSFINTISMLSYSQKNLGDSLSRSGTTAVQFAEAMDDAGVSINELGKLSGDQFDSILNACKGNLEEAAYIIKNYDDLPIKDKNGTITINGDGEIVDANGHIWEWNNGKLVDKTASANVDGNATDGSAAESVDKTNEYINALTGKTVTIGADGSIVDGSAVEGVATFKLAYDSVNDKMVLVDAQGNVIDGTTVEPISDTEVAITGLTGNEVTAQVNGNAVIPETYVVLFNTENGIVALTSNSATAQVNGNAPLSGTASAIWNTANAANSFPTGTKTISLQVKLNGPTGIPGVGLSSLGGGGKGGGHGVKRGGIKRFAQGAIANVSGDGVTFAVEPDGTRDIYGEAGAEAIVPLTNKRYAQPFTDLIADTVVDRLGGVNTGGTNVYIDGARVNDDPAIRRLFIDFMQEMYRKAAMNRG
jgi:TP901 family phage tail tape measure protein